MSDLDPAAWEPGVPLYSRADHPHSCYLFNIRVDSVDDECRCGDAASWPEPVSGRKLSDGDELGDLIAWHRAAREAAS